MEFEPIVTSCLECGSEVECALVTEPMTMKVRGELISVDGVVEHCPDCGADIGDPPIVEHNLQLAFDVYRDRHSVMSPEDIRALRKQYNLSTRDFSLFLGFGEQTEHRYERGSLPTLSQASIIKRASTAEGAEALLKENGERISQEARELVRRFISQEENSACRRMLSMTLCREGDLVPCATNGFRGFDLSRVRQVIYLLASKCRRLYVTKLQKALFFCDNMAVARFSKSLTGLTYAHAPHGPIVDNREGVLQTLMDDGSIWREDTGYGDVIHPGELQSVSLSEEELSVVDEAARFVDTFDSAAEISEFSHVLSCWQVTNEGERISFADSAAEADAAVRERLGNR